jgi:hypothetical protein
MSSAHFPGRFETSGGLASPHLSGEVYAWITEVGGEDPVTIIRADQDFKVHLKWRLKGRLAEFVCGKWCLSIFLESIGPGREIKYPRESLELDLVPCPEDEEGANEYSAYITVPSGTIRPDDCSTPYKLVTTVTYLTPKDNPGPMAGFVEGPIIQFYVP